ncbi:Uma2 family endonuclease [Limnofasciculus baicalensis]|uniref:Uma2 family endonuclease n=1 Tax=Limnofasciculus baicalensis BBK-W-15 TaxID=2699891 RepID=A0AAE3KK54_9CYAN|nr:Uma2 family endonuclease [Limnofasciculus baicalensis]MCP2727215.1 Uma2 family endonuclease [Limnofasciculus baicalensis BBK-W-15]
MIPSSTISSPLTIPPLENGDKLTRAEFERRYEAMAEVKKAELIEGVVYMASPVCAKSHGKPHGAIMGWLVACEAATPGVEALDNTTLRLNADNEPQPDAIEVFPGLWLDISALLAGDLARVIDLL